MTLEASRSLSLAGNGKQASTRLALRKSEAAAALGLSDESFDAYVRPYVRVVRLGSLRLYPLSALEEFLEERAERPLEDVA